MSVYYEDEKAMVYHGDCIEVMRSMPDGSVDAVVTDPPYGIRFMGQAWDGADIVARQERGKATSPMPAGVSGPNGGYRSLAAEAGRYDQSANATRLFQEWCEEWAAECLRVLKPGGHLLAFGSPRAWHRLACGVEDAGFEIRDSIAWLYASGFPKSLSVAKAIESREKTGKSNSRSLREVELAGNGDEYMMTGKNNGIMGETVVRTRKQFVPSSEAAQRWEGWGTALKPGFEPCLVARKPLAGTVAENVLAYGTGALNIDANRIHSAGSEGRTGGNWRPENRDTRDEGRTKDGRFPTNVILDEQAAAQLDAEAPHTVSTVRKPRAGRSGNGWGMTSTGSEYDDRGGPSRFFPTFRFEAKAPTSERPNVSGVQHPTVKPLALMQWLIRLVAPHGATILDPFAGSGTTLEAGIREGVRVIGIERESDYLPLIMQRLSKDIDLPLDLEGGVA